METQGMKCSVVSKVTPPTTVRRTLSTESASLCLVKNHALISQGQGPCASLFTRRLPPALFSPPRTYCQGQKRCFLPSVVEKGSEAH